jgi:hypothetical protein
LLFSDYFFLGVREREGSVRSFPFARPAPTPVPAGVYHPHRAPRLSLPILPRRRQNQWSIFHLVGGGGTARVKVWES